MESKNLIQEPPVGESLFVRVNDEVVFVPSLDMPYQRMLKEKGWPTDRAFVRTNQVDLGVAVRGDNDVALGGRSVIYDWPPRDDTEIRPATENILRRKFPELDLG